MNTYTIYHPIKSKITYEPNSNQEIWQHIISNHKKVIFKKERQTGFSTFAAIYCIDKALKEKTTICFCTLNFNMQKTFHDKLKFIIENGYYDLVISLTKNRITFSNGSEIVFVTSKNIKCVTNGVELDLLIADEAEYFDNFCELSDIFYRFKQIIIASSFEDNIQSEAKEFYNNVYCNKIKTNFYAA